MMRLRGRWMMRTKVGRAPIVAETRNVTRVDPFLDDSKQPSTSKVLNTAISDPGPSKIHASLSRDSSTEEVPVALNSVCFRVPIGAARSTLIIFSTVAGIRCIS